MNINVVSRKDYKNCPIYIRNIGYIWEYLFVYKKKLYGHHMVIKPSWWQRLRKTKYTPLQREKIVNLLLTVAEDHISKTQKQQRINPRNA